MYELRRLLGNPEMVVDLLMSAVIAVIGLWVVLALFDLPEALRTRECPSCLRAIRGGKKCPHCGSSS